MQNAQPNLTPMANPGYDPSRKETSRISSGDVGLTVMKDYTIRNQYGIHARPAALFVKKVKDYDADITVENERTSVSGKSIMGMMTLEAAYGTKITVMVDGPESAEIFKVLDDLIENRHFDEELGGH